MRRIALIAPVALAACAPIPDAPASAVAQSRAQASPGFDPLKVQADLQSSVRTRFGDAAYSAAIGAPAYILAKHYVGLPLPPIAQPDGTYKYPEPPVALLMRQDGQWLVATDDGFRPADADKAAAIDTILSNPAFWSEPEWVQPQCTDAGASLLLLKVPGRDRVIRSGACGATKLTEQLVFRAIES